MGDVSRISDVDRAVSTIVLAFGRDPFVRWLLPEPSAFLTSFSEVVRLHCARTSELGGAYALDDGQAAALWYPPGTHPDGEAIGAVFERAGARERLVRAFEQIAPHAPDGPHWYLRLIGVDPARQGSGLGGRLLEACLAEVDTAGGLAYLEATSTDSRRLYERYGFETLAEVRAGDSPPLFPMARAPR